MKEIPLVSVIIPAFNAEKYISQAIESVVNQTYKNLEIIVINDCSTDKTEEIVKNLMSKYKKVKIIYIKNEKNLGVAETRNKGLIIASGQYIAFLDADDYWFPEKIEKQINYFLEDQEVGLVHTYKVVLKEDGTFWYPTLYYRRLTDSLNGNVYKKLLCGNYICISSVVVKKEVIKTIGFFNREFSVAADWELWIRVAKKYKIGLVKEFLTCYRDHASGMSKNISRYSKDVFQVVGTHIERRYKLLSLKAYGYCYYNIGALYLRNWNTKKALENYLKIETIFSQFLNPYFWRSLVKAVLGKRFILLLKNIKIKIIK